MTGGETLRFERLMPGPPALVFAALTDAALLGRWMCPDGFRVPEVATEPAIGGRFRIVIEAPDGQRYPAAGEYLALKAPDLVEFTWEWERSHTMAGIRTRIRIELSPAPGGTHFVMIHSGLPSPEERESHRGGWTEAIQHLEDLVREESERWTT